MGDGDEIDDSGSAKFTVPTLALGRQNSEVLKLGDELTSGSGHERTTDYKRKTDQHPHRHPIQIRLQVRVTAGPLRFASVRVFVCVYVCVCTLLFDCACVFRRTGGHCCESWDSISVIHCLLPPEGGGVEIPP